MTPEEIKELINSYDGDLVHMLSKFKHIENMERVYREAYWFVKTKDDPEAEKFNKKVYEDLVEAIKKVDTI